MLNLTGVSLSCILYPMKTSGVITLTTDFGLSDPYAAVMKGVILTINPAARLVDITHEIPAGSIFQAAAVIREAFSFFPEGTVHIGVVDPGVGGKRRCIAVEQSDHFFVGPDNGIFWPILEGQDQANVFEITEKRYLLPAVSRTFHGRDVFAPAAAHISRGTNPRGMGPPVADPVQLHIPKPHIRGNVLYGQVIRVDHFGNLITNIHRSDMNSFLGTGRPLIRIGKLALREVRHIYASAEEGEPLALYGSSYYLEIAVNAGKASEQLGLGKRRVIGMEVMVEKSKD